MKKTLSLFLAVVLSAQSAACVTTPAQDKEEISANDGTLPDWTPALLAQALKPWPHTALYFDCMPVLALKYVKGPDGQANKVREETLEALLAESGVARVSQPLFGDVYPGCPEDEQLIALVKSTSGRADFDVSGLGINVVAVTQTPITDPTPQGRVLWLAVGAVLVTLVLVPFVRNLPKFAPTFRQQVDLEIEELFQKIANGELTPKQIELAQAMLSALAAAQTLPQGQNIPGLPERDLKADDVATVLAIYEALRRSLNAAARSCTSSGTRDDVVDFGSFLNSDLNGMNLNRYLGSDQSLAAFANLIKAILRFYGAAAFANNFDISKVPCSSFNVLIKWVEALIAALKKVYSQKKAH